MAVYEELLKDDPSPSHRSELAMALNRICVVLGQLERLPLAREHSARSVSIWRDLYDESPSEYRQKLASSLISHATVLKDLHDPVGAFKTLDEALILAVEVDFAPLDKKAFFAFARLPLIYENAFTALPSSADFQLRSDLGMELVEKLVQRFYDEGDDLSFKFLLSFVHFSRFKKSSSQVLHFQRLFVSKMRSRTNWRLERERCIPQLGILADCACAHFLKTRETSLKEEAIAHSEEAVAITREWVAESGPDLAQAELNLAANVEHLYILRDRVQARASGYFELLEEAEQLIRKQTSKEPADEARLARILYRKAHMPQVPNALELMEEAGAIYFALHAKDAASHHGFYLTILGGLSMKYREKKMWKEGLAISESALSLLQEETLQKANWLLTKAEFQKKTASFSKETLETVTEHIRIQRRFFNEDRGKYLKQMSDSLREAASLVFMVDNKVAYEWIVEGISLLREMVAKDETRTNALASALLTQSNIAVQLRDYENALRTGKECIQTLDYFGSKADPDILARALYALGRKRLEGKSVEESTAMLRRSVEIRKRLVGESQGRTQESHLIDLCRALESLGDVLRFGGHVDEARLIEQEEVAAREALVPFDRKRFYPELASALKYQFNKNPEQVHLIERAISIYREAVAEQLHERAADCLSRSLKLLADFREANREV